MRNNIFKFLFLLITYSAATSCYEDKSKLDSNKMPEVVIDTTGCSGDIIVGFLDNIVVKPAIFKQGVENHEDLVCTWSMTEIPSNSSYLEVQQGLELDFNVDRAIEERPYKLQFKVTDTEVDFSYYIYWNVFVTSTFGDGILVAYTDDNKTSDIGLINDKDISDSYTKDAKVKTAIFSGANGHKIPSLVKDATYTKRPNLRTNTMWFTLESGDFISMDLVSYKDNEVKMVFAPDGLKMEQIYDSGQLVLFSSNNGIYSVGMNDIGPSMPFASSDKGVGASNLFISADNDNGPNANMASWYSEEKGAFYGLPSMFQISATPYPEELDAHFNPADVPNKECMAADLSSNKSDHTFLLRDKTSGDYAIYTLLRGDNDGLYPRAGQRSDIPSAAKAVIDAAVSIFFMIDYSIMYVATETGIYTINFSSTTAVFDAMPKYTPESGEKITVAKLYQEGLYTTARDNYDVTSEFPEIANIFTDRAIVVGSNKGEFDGIVTIVPMVSNGASSGLLDKDVTKQRKYVGFGKILDITTTYNR